MGRFDRESTAWLYRAWRHMRRRARRGGAARAALYGLSSCAAVAAHTATPPQRCPIVGRPDDAATGHLPRIWLHSVITLLAITLIVGEALGDWSESARQRGADDFEQADIASGVAGGSDRALPALPFGKRGEQALQAVDLVPAAHIVPEAPALFPTRHYLAPGETLGALATRYGVTLESLVWASDLQNGDVLMVGQELRIPQVSGVPYTLVAGDSPESLAARFGTTAEAILSFRPNGLRPGAALPGGREIFIPGGQLPLPAELLALRGGLAGLAASAAQPAGVVREPQTNLRAGPGQSYVRLAQLEAGRRAQLLGRSAQWLKVDVAGATGWVRADLLAVAGAQVATLPEITDLPPPPPTWVWPARGTLTSAFGPRWGSFHNGIDIANRAWTPIVAARAGTVAEAGWCRGYGYCVRLRHGGGVNTIYGHMVAQPVVRAGESVAAGQLIGHMGSTYDRAGGGYSTGVHLHFTVTINGRAVNPLTLLP